MREGEGDHIRGGPGKKETANDAKKNVGYRPYRATEKRKPGR